jgi:hypothetical protein
MSSNRNDPLPYAVIGFFAGFYYFFKGFRTFREYRVVDDTPEMPIRSIAMGLVRIHGKATGDELVPSPISHTPSHFYKVDIEKWHTDRRGGHWSNYRTDADGVKFYLQDNSGKALVDAHGAEYDLVQTARREMGGGSYLGSSGGANEAELRSYITQVTAKKISSFVERRLNAQRPGLDEELEKRRQAALQLFQHPVGSAEFLEQMLAAQGPRLQQHLEAMGPQSDPQKEQARLAMIEAYKHPVGSPEFRENMQRAMAAQGGPGNLATPPVTATPPTIALRIGRSLSSYPAMSGRFRFTEYCVSPGHWYDLTGTCTENPNPRDEHDRNLILKGQNEPTFLISYRTPKEVESKLRRRAAAQIFGGAALSIACLAYILYRLHMF